jgi:hypothetical protein
MHYKYQDCLKEAAASVNNPKIRKYSQEYGFNPFAS